MVLCFSHFEHEFPIGPSLMTKWRKKVMTIGHYTDILIFINEGVVQ